MGAPPLPPPFRPPAPRPEGPWPGAGGGIDRTPPEGRRPVTGSHPVPPPEGPRTGTSGVRPARSAGGPLDPPGRATATGVFATTTERATEHPAPEPPGAGHATTTGRFGAVERPAERCRDEVPDGRTSTGSHRAVGKVAGRRRIAAWPIVLGVFILLIVAGLLGWGWANSVLNSRAEAQANACTDGDSTMRVLVTPSIQRAVTEAATKWNEAKTVVHSHCVHIDVQAAPSARVFDALSGKTALDSIGGLPAAWVPENSYWISQLQTTKPGMIGSPAESIASASSFDYPFVGLAGATVDEVQARAAQVFRDFLKEPAQQSAFAQPSGATG